MGFLVSFMLISFGLNIGLRRKSFASPDVLFSIEFGVISLLASLRLYGLYDINTKTWCIIVLGYLTFIVGSILGEEITNKDVLSVNHQNNFTNSTPFMKEKTFWIFVSLILLLMIDDFQQTISFLKQGYTLSEIRDASVGMTELAGYERKTGFFYEYFTLIISVIELFTVATGIEAYVRIGNKKLNMILAVLFIEVFKSFTNGGRFALAYLLIEIIVCFMLYKKSINDSISEKIRKWIQRISLILCILIVIVTIVRGSDISEITKKYYRYICGNLVFFDIHVKEIDNSSFSSWPFASLYGLWSFILPILNVLGIGYPTKYLNTITSVMNGQEFRQIGEGLYTNAFITPFYHLYADARWFGVVIGMLVFGLISGITYKRAINNKTSQNTIFYLVIVQMLFKSLQMYPFVSKTYVLALIAMFMIRRKRVGVE